jgi:hypothetical protein
MASEIEDAWGVEVDRRIDEIERDAVELIPVVEAIARARSAIK